MTCQDTNNILIRFPDIGLELRPYTVDFRIDRNQLDYLDAKFSKEVGDYLEPYTQNEGAVMRSPMIAEVVMDEVVSHTMYFRPEYVTYGETNCWIELHDPQKHLKHEVIDDKFNRVTAKEVYKYILHETGGEILPYIDFHIPDSATSDVPKEVPRGPGGIPVVSSTGSGGVGVFNTVDNVGGAVDKFTSIWKDYDEGDNNGESGQTILDSIYKFDLENKTGLEALYTVNEELGLTSWVNDKGGLMVGLDFMDAAHHVASANDSRVWRYHNAEITPPGSPIKMAIVQGGMIDAPNNRTEEDWKESVYEFSTLDSHEADLIPQGVAQRPEVLDGKIVTVDQPNLSRDALPERAQQVLANEMTNNNSGTVEINPETSGTEISDWRNVEVGDFIQLIPAEGDDCKDLNRGMWLISGVKHKVDGGSWKLKLNVQKWANPDPVVKLRYFSPNSKNYYESTSSGGVGEKINTDE